MPSHLCKCLLRNAQLEQSSILGHTRKPATWYSYSTCSRTLLFIPVQEGPQSMTDSARTSASAHTSYLVTLRDVPSISDWNCSNFIDGGTPANKKHKLWKDIYFSGLQTRILSKAKGHPQSQQKVHYSQLKEQFIAGRTELFSSHCFSWVA